MKDFGSWALLKPKWDQGWVACFWQTGLLGGVARCGPREQNQTSCVPREGLGDGAGCASELPRTGISIQCHCLQLRASQLQWNSLFHLWQKSQSWEPLLLNQNYIQWRIIIVADNQQYQSDELARKHTTSVSTTFKSWHHHWLGSEGFSSYPTWHVQERRNTET